MLGVWLYVPVQVNAAKAALEVALTRATQQRSGYEPYREMARYDHQLDLASLAPAYKLTCAMAAKAITGVLTGVNVCLLNTCNSSLRASSLSFCCRLTKGCEEELLRMCLPVPNVVG